MNKTVVELFAGVGGFRVGLNHIKKFDSQGLAIENGDWKFVWANQWEPSTKAQDAFNCYITRFGDTKNHSNEDINKVDKYTIPDHTLLVGGFPCQDYSVARTKSGEKGIQGKKGVLFWEIAEILEIKNTPYVLLENVDRLLKSPAAQRGRDFGVMLRTLHDLGYNAEWRVINAADYGAAQRRRRVFIFAWKKSSNYNNIMLDGLDIINEVGLFAKVFPVKEIQMAQEHYVDISKSKYKDTVEITNKFQEQFKNTGVMLNGIVTHAQTIPIKETSIPLKDILEKKAFPELHLTAERLEKMKFLKGSKRIKRTHKNGHEYFYSEGQMSFPEDINLPGRTMLTSEGSMNRSTHVVPDNKNGNLRIITPIEAERLQHFPDNWTNTGMSNSRRYFMMGNALVTNIIAKLEPELAKIVNL